MSIALPETGIPTEFLEAYPFAALVLLVRSRNGGQQEPESQTTSPDIDGAEIAESASEYASSVPESSSSAAFSHAVDAYRDPLLDAPALREVDNNAEASGTQPRSYMWECPSFARYQVAPVSAPLNAPPRLVWANEHWNQFSKGLELQDVVGPHALAALQEWAEIDNPADAALTPSRASCFELELGALGQVIELVKSRRPVSPNNHTHALVVLTAVGPPRSDTRPRRLPDPTLAATAVRLVYGGMRPPPAFSIMIPHRTPSGEYWTMPADSTRKHPVVAQCHVLLEEIDWAATTNLGPFSTWHPAIVSTIRLAFSSFTKDCIFVGPELNMIYNQSYSRMVGHPKCFGRPVAEVWQALWPSLKPLFDRAQAGEPVHRENDLVLHQRDDRGRFVERYQTYSIIPITDGSKKVLGLYNPSYDTTNKVLLDRRLTTSRDLMEQVSAVKTSRAFYKAVTRVLERNPADSPFVICYGVSKRNEYPSTSTVVDLRLQSSVGVPRHHPSVPTKLSCALPPSPDPTCEKSIADNLSHLKLNDTARLRSFESKEQTPSSSSISSLSDPRPKREMLIEYNPSSWPIQRALATKQCIIVDGCAQLVKGFHVRQWDSVPDRAVVMPLTFDTSEEGPPPQAVIILGLNLFRPLDAEYDDWIQAIRAHLASALDSVTSIEEEAHRRAELEKLEKAKSTWFRGSAHEFQTPLNLISAPLEDLQETELSHRQRQGLVIAMRNVHRLQGLVSSLLQFSRMEAGTVAIQPVPTDLATFTDELLTIFEPAIRKKGIQSVLCVEQREQPTVVDPALLEMVLSHLLVATLKSARNDRICVELKFNDNEFATFEVADTCLQRPSTRVETSTAPEHWNPPSLENGEQADVELGVALARHIVRLHGGDLWSETVKPLGAKGGPTGSVMTARLPLNLRASDTPVPPAPFGIFARQLAREVISMSTVEDSAETALGLMPSTIVEGLVFERSDVLLIVDDNPDGRDYYKNVFAPFCTVIEAASGAEALAISKKVTPDLILSDWLMRPMGALELLTVLRKQSSTKFVPFLVVSAASDDESRVEAYMAGVDDYMLKPVRSKELLLRVHLHMQMGKKRAKLEKLFAEQLLEVERGRREAEESRQHQEFLVDLISHEIRTPVSAVLQCSSLVKENLAALKEQLRFSKDKGFWPSAELLADLEDDVSALDSIYQCGLVQERIAGDVLSLACIQRQMLSFHDVEMNFRQETQNVLSIFNNEARMKRVDLQLTFGDTLDQLGIELIKTDPVRLGQVITNLTSNAIRFTTQSEVRKIMVHAEAAWEPPAPGSCALPAKRDVRNPNPSSGETPVYIYVSVTDTGPGIKNSEQKVLFNSFHQGNKVIHTQYGGSGLGLFICKNISSLLGGGIEVESELGRGTVFRFFIKALAVRPEPEEPAAEHAPLPRLLSDPLPSPPAVPMRSQRWGSLDSPQPLHVLIVEDNIINQTVLKRQLLKAKFTCATANDGQQALVAIHEANRKARFGDGGAFDVILMDLEMPVMDGLTTVRHIREAEAAGTLSPQLVIALTGNARQGQREQALAAGMNDVMIKPYRLAQLIEKMQESVADHRRKHASHSLSSRRTSRAGVDSGREGKITEEAI